MPLRDYQREAIDAAVAAYENGKRRVVMSLATGLGKTLILSHLPLYALPRKHDMMLVIVHRDELIRQTVDKLMRVHPDVVVGVEAGPAYARGSEPLVVASVATLRRRMKDFFERVRDRIGLLVIDEAHHAAAATYRAIMDAVTTQRPDSLIVGVTATPERGDGLGLQDVFQEIVIHRDLRWGINQGYLVPLTSYRVTTTTSLDELRLKAGAIASEADLTSCIDVDERNARIVSAYQQHAAGKKAIVFCRSVLHAQHIDERFRRAGVASAYASGETAEREQRAIVRAFRTGSINVLVNCSLYVEGFDVPDAEVLIAARPTQSQALYVQQVGRVLRPLDTVAGALGAAPNAAGRRRLITESLKPSAMVLDIVDIARRHSLVTTPTLWGLPASFAPQGANLDEVADKHAMLVARDRHAAAYSFSIEDVQTQIDRLDAFAIRRLDVRATNWSRLAWRPVDDGTYRITMPAGRSERGEALEIEQTGERFEVRLETVEGSRLLGATATLREAFTRAEGWLRHNRSNQEGGLLRDASWRKLPLTTSQHDALRKAKVPPHLIPEFRGDASLLIEQLTTTRSLGAARGGRSDQVDGCPG